MPSLPQELIDALNAAEGELAAASERDGLHAANVAALTLAQAAESKSASDAIAAHRDANAAASAALDALKKHFGL